MKPLSRWPHAIAVAAHLGLVAGLIASSRSLLGLLLALLLFLPLPGLLRGHERTHAATSMLIAFYCAGLLSNAYVQSEGRALSFVLAAVAAVEFCAVMMYVRWRAHERRAAA